MPLDTTPLTALSVTHFSRMRDEVTPTVQISLSATPDQEDLFAFCTANELTIAATGPVALTLDALAMIQEIMAALEQ